MAALNQSETEMLSLASTSMRDAAMRLKRAFEKKNSDVVEIDLTEVEFMIDSLKKAERLVDTVKQLKGYYPS